MVTETDIDLDRSNKWYLAYGSNLSSKVFQGRRGIRPLELRRVHVPELEIVFDLPGFPYWEPAFANVRHRTSSNGVANTSAILSGSAPISSTPELIGVAYLLTSEDYRTVIETEGGGTSYQEFAVECNVLSDNEKEKAAFSEERIVAYTLLAPDGARHTAPLQPSKRYIHIIQAGAREHDLPSDYIAFVDSVTYYRRTSRLQLIGGILFIMTWVVPFVGLYFGGRALSDKETGRMPPWLIRLQTGIRSNMWWTYEKIFKPIFGDGEVTDGSILEGKRGGTHFPSTTHVDAAQLEVQD